MSETLLKVDKFFTHTYEVFIYMGDSWVFLIFVSKIHTHFIWYSWLVKSIDTLDRVVLSFTDRG